MQRSSLVNGHSTVNKLPSSQHQPSRNQIAQRLSSGQLAESAVHGQHVPPACIWQTVAQPAISNKVYHPAFTVLKVCYLHSLLPTLCPLRPPLPCLHAGPVQNGRAKPTTQQAEGAIRKPHMQNGSIQLEATQRPAGQQRSMAPPPQPRASHAPAPASRYSVTLNWLYNIVHHVCLACTWPFDHSQVFNTSWSRIAVPSRRRFQTL